MIEDTETATDKRRSALNVMSQDTLKDTALCSTKLNKKNGKDRPSGKSNANKLNKDQNHATGPTASVGLGSPIEECGLYVDLKIQGETARFLVDTGATVTLVSKSLCTRLPISVKPNLHTITQTIMTTNSTALPVNGKAEFNVCIDQMTYYIEAIVAKLIDYLGFYVPLKNISLIWRRHHCR
jgi:hypothetical protein